MARRITRFLGIGGRIKKLREANGWTQSELARLAGGSQSNVNLVEKGNRDDLKATTIIKYATALHITTDELLGYDVNAIPQPALGEQDGRRLDALEKGLLQVGEMLQKIDAKIDDQQKPAKTSQKKQSQRKRP